MLGSSWGGSSSSPEKTRKSALPVGVFQMQLRGRRQVEAAPLPDARVEIPKDWKYRFESITDAVVIRYHSLPINPRVGQCRTRHAGDDSRRGEEMRTCRPVAAGRALHNAGRVLDRDHLWPFRLHVELGAAEARQNEALRPCTTWPRLSLVLIPTVRLSRRMAREGQRYSSPLRAARETGLTWWSRCVSIQAPEPAFILAYCWFPSVTFSLSALERPCSYRLSPV
jgi:hypothetical protein